MKIEKNECDKAYPYIIKDGWGGELCVSEEELKELQEKIKITLDK